MAIFANTPATLDEATAIIENATPRLRKITIPAAAYTTPFWLRFIGGGIEQPMPAATIRIDSLPFTTTRMCAEFELLTFDPSGPECP